MYSPTIHLTHEVILSLLITRGRVDFNKDSTVKVLVGTLFCTSHHLTQIFFRSGLAIFTWYEPHSSGQLQGVWNTFHTYPEPECLEQICRQSNWLTRSHNGAWLWFLSSSTWSSPAVSHPSTIQAQCCLTSVFEWELVFPT